MPHIRLQFENSVTFVLAAVRLCRTFLKRFYGNASNMESIFAYVTWPCYECRPISACNICCSSYIPVFLLGRFTTDDDALSPEICATFCRLGKVEVFYCWLIVFTANFYLKK
jgi:hypothetical protein